MTSPSPSSALPALDHPGESIPECIEHYARTLPDGIAVKTRTQQLTYAELNRRPIASRAPCWRAGMQAGARWRY